MDVAHAILFAKAIDISRVTADYSSAKFESLKKELAKTDAEKEQKNQCESLFISTLFLQ